MPVDPKALASSLERFTPVRSRRTAEHAAHLQEVVDASRAVLGVDGAALMMVDDEGALRVVTSTDDAAQRLEESQVDTGVGPGIDVVVHGDTVRVTDLSSDPRWPGLWQRIGRHDVRGVLSTPVRADGRVAGTLNLLTGRATEWSDADATAGAAYADVVGAMLRLAAGDGNGD